MHLLPLNKHFIPGIIPQDRIDLAILGQLDTSGTVGKIQTDGKQLFWEFKEFSV